MFCRITDFSYAVFRVHRDWSFDWSFFIVKSVICRYSIHVLRTYTVQIQNFVFDEISLDEGMMIAICDYDAGNIMSVQKACAFLGHDYVLTRDRKTILSADHVILPGVGAFGDAMNRLDSYGLSDVLREVADQGTPLLGICLGLQLLFERSDESPGACGLGLLPGAIVRIPDQGGKLKIPHMGWNSLSLPVKSRLFEGIPEGTQVYFVHSFYLPCPSVQAQNPEPEYHVTAVADYGVPIGASVERKNVAACQFHPEKSGRWGLQILDNFLRNFTG